MKKLYLLVLLAVSMSFAMSIKYAGNGGLGTSASSGNRRTYFHNVSIYLENGWSRIQDGFVYFYFSVPMTEESVKKTVVAKQRDPYIDVSIERMTINMYRAKAKLPPKNYAFYDNWLFKEQGSVSVNFAIQHSDGSQIEIINAPKPCDRCSSHEGIVVMDSKDSRIWGNHPFVSKKRRIGVLKKGSKCEGEEVMIRLDTEDSSNRNKVRGDSTPPGISVNKNGVKFTYCVIERDVMPKVPYDYAVLRLDVECPEGAKKLGRFHDTEDSDNNNNHSGIVWPSAITNNADIEYCVAVTDGGADRKYPFESKYGVFANPSSSVSKYISHSEIYVDDEDGKNKNDWYWYREKSTKDLSKHIMDGEDNTTYHVIKWTGSDQAMLAKSAEVADNSVSSAYVAAAPLAPAIKGFNRSAVTVELKSAGRVVVSVMNIRGDVIATVSQDNMQPGIHMVNWNSGAVPNGRYVVAVKQNGKFSAKNVILK